MSIELDFFIPSSDKVSRIHGTQWVADGRTRAVLQLSHGMIEHIGRYRQMAKYLNRRGISVIGHDHLGHGRTTSVEAHGIFAGENGAYYVLEDLRLVSEYIKRQYPDIPHFLLGHSMGSFFVRRFLTIYGEMVDGVILTGTGEQHGFTLIAGSAVVARAVKKKGRSAFDEKLHNLVLGGYNKLFAPAKTRHDWLSRDMKEAIKYEADPDCQFIFSNGAYEDFFQIMTDLYFKKQFERIPKNLPVLLLSGTHDPVGQKGKGVNRAYKKLKEAGVTDISIKLYPGARHELINETNRLEVFEDIKVFIAARIQ